VSSDDWTDGVYSVGSDVKDIEGRVGRWLDGNAVSDDVSLLDNAGCESISGVDSKTTRSWIPKHPKNTLMLEKTDLIEHYSATDASGTW
jgi:hypothetical protein